MCCTEARATALSKSSSTHLSCHSHPQRLLVISNGLLAVTACPSPHQNGLMAEREEEMDEMFRQGYRLVMLSCRSRHILMVRTGKPCNWDFILRDRVIHDKKVLKKWVKNQSLSRQKMPKKTRL